jgi:hypothetical protein
MGERKPVQKGAKKSDDTTRSEFIVGTIMISRGIVNTAFSARAEFSVYTHGRLSAAKDSPAWQATSQALVDMAEMVTHKKSRPPEGDQDSASKPVPPRA